MDEGRQSLKNLRVYQTKWDWALAKLGSAPCTLIPTLDFVLCCSSLPSPSCSQSSFEAPPLSGIFPPCRVGWCLEWCRGCAAWLVGLTVDAVLGDSVWWLQ